MRMGSIIGPANERIGLMLVPNQEGLMVGRKQQMLDSVVPSVQEYGSAPVYRERTFVARPTAGYGERVQSSFGDRRYYWCLDVQVDGDLFGKGPLIHQVAPTTAAGGYTTQFIDAPNASGVSQQFILAGTKVYRRADDTNAGQSVDKDFGAGVFPSSAVLYQGGFSGATPSLYVATTTGTLWERNNAGTWTQCALPSGFAPSFLEVVATELWAAAPGTSTLRKVTSDPKVAANWSGPLFVGSPSVPINCIRQTGNQLTTFKSDGSVWTLNSDGSVNDLFPGLRVPQNTLNAATAQAWLGSLWFRAGPTFYRLDVPGNQLTPTGPGKLLDNGSPVRGDTAAFCGWGGYRAYQVINGSTDGTAYLLTYGNWEPHVTDQGVQWTFDDQYDGAIAHWTARVATCMAVSGASGTDRLYVGFQDGQWDWIKLVKHPLGVGSGAEFTTGTSEMVFPLHTAMFDADLKHWLGFSVFGPTMAAGDGVQLYYRLMASAGAPPADPTGNWLSLGQFTANGQRIDAPSNLVGNALSLKASLLNTTTTDTPVIEVIAFHERVVPAFKRDLMMTVDAGGFHSRLDGAVVRLDSDALHQALLGFAATPGSLAIELPDETVNEIALFGYSERMTPMQAGGGRNWVVDIQTTQFRILTVYGIIKRLRGTRIGDLRGYHIGSLRTL